MSGNDYAVCNTCGDVSRYDEPRRCQCQDDRDKRIAELEAENKRLRKRLHFQYVPGCACEPITLDKCPNCGGVADNGHDRCDTPSPYYCTKCEQALEESESCYQPTEQVTTTGEG